MEFVVLENDGSGGIIAEGKDQPAPAPEQNWWYYCAQANGYYPYVKICPTSWTRVSPVPPGQ